MRKYLHGLLVLIFAVSCAPLHIGSATATPENSSDSLLPTQPFTVQPSLTVDVCIDRIDLASVQVYYLANLEDGVLYINTIDGENEQMAWQVKNLKNFDVSPNGKRVLGRIADGYTEEWILGDLGETEFIQLGDVEEYAWSSDGDVLLYFDDDAQELFMISQGEMQPTSLVSLDEFASAEFLHVSWPVWSSIEKKAVVFVSAYKTSTQPSDYVRKEKVQSKVILVNAETKEIKTVFQPDDEVDLWDAGWSANGSKFSLLFIRNNPEPKFGIMFQVYDADGNTLGNEQQGMLITADYSGSHWLYFDFKDDTTYAVDYSTLGKVPGNEFPRENFLYDGWLGNDSIYRISVGSGYNNGNPYDFYRIYLATGSPSSSQESQRTEPLLSLSSPKIAPNHIWLLVFSNPHLYRDENITPRKETTELWVVDANTEQIFSVNVETPKPIFDPKLQTRKEKFFPDHFVGEFSPDSRYYLFYSIDQAFANMLYLYDHCTRSISIPGLVVDLPEIQIVQLAQSTEMGKIMRGKFDFVWNVP